MIRREREKAKVNCLFILDRKITNYESKTLRFQEVYGGKVYKRKIIVW